VGLLVAVLPPAVPAVAAADSAAGQQLFQARCTACHSLHPTRKPGPILSGVFGRRAGSVPEYHYSVALKDAGITWNATTLDHWLSGPPKYIPGVNMMAQVDSEQQRQDLIAYLRSISHPTSQHTASTSP
jgi:cytochrome c